MFYKTNITYTKREKEKRKTKKSKIKIKLDLLSILTNPQCQFVLHHTDN